MYQGIQLPIYLLSALLFASISSPAPVWAAAPRGAVEIPYERFDYTDAEAKRFGHPGAEDCLERSGGNTGRMRDCSAMEFELLDVHLNLEYRNALGRLTTSASARNCAIFRESG